MRIRQTYPLNPAETVYAPFQDETIRNQLDYHLVVGDAKGCEMTGSWAGVNIRWESTEPGEHALDFILHHEVHCGRFDRLLASVSMPDWVEVAVAISENGSQWVELDGGGAGRNSRCEFSCPLGGIGHFAFTRLRFFSRQDRRTIVSLIWLGLAEADFYRELEARRPAWDESWEGFLLPVESWGGPSFERGIVFAGGDLEVIRRRSRLPDWREHWSVLRARAEKAMARRPEDDIGEYIPWNDRRYSRAREHDREPFYLQGPLLGFVGLVENDRRMMFHALRFLMSMVHCDHWCQSKESDLNGSVWDQRCFMEEETATAVATLWDWFGFALTGRAREYLARTLWRRGLAVIEGDMMRWEYVYHINQGAWFCRARILGGLMLETHWPRMGSYVDRAVTDMLEALDNYILEDGGSDEGSGYMALTLHTTLPALMAYARLRGRAIGEFLPRNLSRVPAFLAATSRVEPGCHLMDGDSSTDYLVGDSLALLRKLLGDPRLDGMLAGTLVRERPFTYFNQYIEDGILTLVHGPDHVPPARCVVPEFAIFEKTGHLTSLRRGTDFSVRIHVVGCKANPSHSHLDKGNFTLEVDATPMLVDRGTVRYDNPNSQILQDTAWANVISLLRDGAGVGQVLPATPVVPTGHGDAVRLRAVVDLTPAWKDSMHRCERRIGSDSPGSFVVTDSGALKEPAQVVFNLQANVPFETGGKRAVLNFEGHCLEIHAPWAESAAQAEEGIDYLFRPVYRLRLVSPRLVEFALPTTITILR